MNSNTDNNNASYITQNIFNFVREIQRNRMSHGPAQNVNGAEQAQVPMGPDQSKLPPELLVHLKQTETQNPDGTQMSDQDKRKAALNKAKQYKQQKETK